MRMYYIDIVDGCNLSCTTCEPQSIRRPRSFMKLSLFRDILNKIENEDKDKDITIALYCYSEPLLHPELEEFIKAVKEKGFMIDVSTSLNNEDISHAVSTPPDRLIVALSGYYQDIYSQSHKGGSINLVLSNLYKLRHLMDKHGKSFEVNMTYYIYKHNLGTDIEQIEAISKDLGFTFCSDLAFLQGFDNVLHYLDLVRSSQPLPNNFEKAKSILFFTPLEISEMFSPGEDTDVGHCRFYNQMPHIRADGSVGICFGLYDRKYTRKENFLDMDYSEFETNPDFPICKECYKEGVHYYLYWKNHAIKDEVNKKLNKMGIESKIGDNVRYYYPWEEKSVETQGKEWWK
ncbi:MAG: 4Fe-4S cluster-binding domain-containing protein [Desulfobacteraceae bacterium]|nr:4Fe-4S cluster-binding domain-containing protein [Desulfobacteraceae bacterium]